MKLFESYIDTQMKEIEVIVPVAPSTENAKQMYANEMVSIFTKAIRDELSASIAYRFMAESLVGMETEELRDELIEHADEEYTHFTELVTYASNHGILANLRPELDSSVVHNYPTEARAIMGFVQDLEMQAIRDYISAAKFARHHGDIETCAFFKELASDERGHFDDLAPMTGDTREFEIEQ